MSRKDKLWVVKSSDDVSMTLKEVASLGLVSTTVQYTHVTSVDNVVGIFHVHTTSGRTYKVVPGFRRKMKDACRTALSRFGVEV